MLEAIRLLRVQYRFNGYIHVKTIPGASMELTQEVDGAGGSHECESGTADGRRPAETCPEQEQDQYPQTHANDPEWDRA